MTNKYPTISFCIATYNEEKNIARCLDSLFNQKYPSDKIEVILVDDKSSDQTIKIAKKYPVKILINGTQDADRSFGMGFQAAKGEYFSALDADMELVQSDWIRLMVQSLMENPTVSAAFTKYYSNKNETLLTKYLSLDPIQRDLVYQLFSPGFEAVISKRKKDYFLCEYTKDKIPPQSHGVYRVKTMRTLLEKSDVWYDMGNLVLLVQHGYSDFTYVPKAGYYHYHANSLQQLLHKRQRNIQRSYLRYTNKKNQYTWFNLKNPKDLLKIILLIISANLVIPLLILSLYRMIKNKQWLYILDAPVTFLLVDTILISMLADIRGRRLIKTMLRKNMYE